MGSRRTTAIVIGAGPGGLAASRHLAELGVDHVVLERGVVANAWRTERWDSLRLLTPNHLSLLPGDEAHAEPDGFMAAGELADRLVAYGARHAAPVRTGTTVASVEPGPSGFTVTTGDGSWSADAVVVASGASGAPRLPSLAAQLPTRLHQLAAARYRNPDDVGDGPVLVVGASASGVQLADELAEAGREVTIAVGDHVRLPRTYRGQDIYDWMDGIGLLDERDDQVEDLDRARRLPSAQLIGTPERRDLDLASLGRRGVTVAGRLAGIDRGDALFSGSLANLVRSADLKLHRLLDRIDAHVDATGRAGDVGPPDRPPLTELPVPPTRLALDRFDTVLWATGNRAHLPFLPPALLDRHGRLRHRRGAAEVPGLYLVGVPVMRTRRSGLLGGIGADARDVADLVAGHVGARRWVA